MSILTLHNALRALRPTGIDHYAGQAPANPTPPWLVTGFATPDITASEAALGIAKTGTLTVTIATLTEDATTVWVERVDECYVGARVQVEGWTVGALVAGVRSGPYPAGLTALDTNLRYQVARIGYRFTYSRTA